MAQWCGIAAYDRCGVSAASLLSPRYDVDRCRRRRVKPGAVYVDCWLLIWILDLRKCKMDISATAW